MKCRGTSKTSGKPCRKDAIPGGFVCDQHGGAAPQVKDKAMVRAEVARWGLDNQDTTVDPGEVLLRLLSQSHWRAERYAEEVEALVDQAGGSIADALTGTQKVINGNGNLVAVGEYIGAMVTLESQERDRAARFAEMAVKAKLSERQQRLADQQGALINLILGAVFERMGFTVQQRKQAMEIIEAEVEHLSA